MTRFTVQSLNISTVFQCELNRLNITAIIFGRVYVIISVSLLVGLLVSQITRKLTGKFPLNFVGNDHRKNLLNSGDDSDHTHNLRCFWSTWWVTGIMSYCVGELCATSALLVIIMIFQLMQELFLYFTQLDKYTDYNMMLFNICYTMAAVRQ